MTSKTTKAASTSTLTVKEGTGKIWVLLLNGIDDLMIVDKR